jgi:hypothetical protein
MPIFFVFRQYAADISFAMPIIISLAVSHGFSAAAAG